MLFRKDRWKCKRKEWYLKPIKMDVWYINHTCRQISAWKQFPWYWKTKNKLGQKEILQKEYVAKGKLQEISWLPWCRLTIGMYCNDFDRHTYLDTLDITQWPIAQESSQADKHLRISGSIFYLVLGSCFTGKMAQDRPADRFIIATAIHHDIKLVSMDGRSSSYGELDHLLITGKNESPHH